MNKCFLGDCRDSMRKLIADGIKVQTCVTSPPYFGLRDYKVAGQLGLEATPAEFVANMVEVFDLVRELLADNGTLWLNLGDSYAANRGYQVPSTLMNGDMTNKAQAGDGHGMKAASLGFKPKDLMGMPWRVAFALQDAGWYLRQDIIWAKPNPMPESVTDRCTKSHEYLFLLSKSERYYYDQEAILEPCSPNTHARLAQDIQNQVGSERANGGAKTNGNMKAVSRKQTIPSGWATDTNRQTVEIEGRYSHKRKLAEAGNGKVKNNESMDAALAIMPTVRNRRSVWNIPTEAYSEAHFATFPTALVEPCILAGSPVGGIVFDPFLGSGTTAQVAQALGRQWIGCELNPEYFALQDKRTRQNGLALEFA